MQRIGANVNVYLVLRQGELVLLQMRKNTGYCDGMWSLVAGHVESGEPATDAMIREAREEASLTLNPEQIQVAHAMHRKTDRLNVDLFFNCLSWQGVIQNCEPEKCEELRFFPLNSLPTNTIDYIAQALRHIQEGTFYSELGWQTNERINYSPSLM